MIKEQDVFFELPCLTEISRPLSGVSLYYKWFKSADKRIIGQYLQKFIDYNSELFEFLKIEPYLIGSDSNISLAFKSAEFVGAIPLKSSSTGMQIGDFIVTPRYSNKNLFDDYSAILDLLGSEITPEFRQSLPLASGKNFRPPLYLEAINFINCLEQLVKIHWRKFDVFQEKSFSPVGQINWNQYSIESYKPENHLNFPTRKNILTEIHNESNELRFVFDICLKELLSPNTPQKVKHNIRKRLSFLEEKLYNHKPAITNYIKINIADNSIVKACKIQANKILHHNSQPSTAWRIDFNNVFEKFVQYLFRLASNEIGGKIYTNKKINSISSRSIFWTLEHLEPDAVYLKEELIVFIDAKYKSHLFNKNNYTFKLKEDHRHDLHQILGYSSFTKSANKHAFLCYPSNKVEFHTIKYTSPIDLSSCTVYICGFPLLKSSIHKSKNQILSILNTIK